MGSIPRSWPAAAGQLRLGWAVAASVSEWKSIHSLTRGYCGDEESGGELASRWFDQMPRSLLRGSLLRDGGFWTEPTAGGKQIVGYRIGQQTLAVDRHMAEIREIVVL